jgi:type II secretory pathway pseudopilin PulG
MKRRGKTLVELLVVISMLGGLLGASGTVIYRMMRAERAVETDMAWQRTVTELAEQFRADVHIASVANVIDGGTGLTLTLPEGTVAYSLTQRGVRRVWQPKQGTSLQQEYRCHETGVRFATEDHLGRIWATVVIPRSASPLAKSVDLPTEPILAVRAVLGRYVLPPNKEGVS